MDDDIDIGGVPHRSVCVMKPSGDRLRILVPSDEAAAILAQGVIRFVLCPQQESDVSP